jgi:glycosyltransferase involved in cell wall biosynthesis
LGNVVDKQLKIAFVIKTLSLPGGGAERVLADVSAELARRGYYVEIVTFDSGQSFYHFEVPVHSLNVGRGSGPANIISRTMTIRRWVKMNKPDAVIAFMHSAYVPCAFAFMPAPLIASEHIVYSHYRTRPVENLLARIARRLSDAVTVVTEPMRKGFPASEGMHVIPNPIVPAKGRADPIGTGRRTILSIGRMEEQKNQALLLKAFATVADEFPDWQLRIVGHGSLRPKLKQLVHELGLIGRASLPDAHPHVADEYRRAQIFAIPSTYESFGLVTAEALQYCLPVVGLTSCPGTNELIIDGQNGILTEERLFADALRCLMGNDSLRAKLATGLAEPDRFALSSVADRWSDLIRGAVKDWS